MFENIGYICSILLKLLYKYFRLMNILALVECMKILIMTNTIYVKISYNICIKRK